MKIKVHEIKGIAEGLEEILGKELPVKPAYWFGRILNKVVGEFRVFETTRLKLVEKYAEKGEDGKPKLDKKTNRFVMKDEEGFMKEFEEFADTEIELDFNPIKLEALGDISLKPATMAKLSKLIEE